MAVLIPTEIGDVQKALTLITATLPEEFNQVSHVEPLRTLVIIVANNVTNIIVGDPPSELQGQQVPKGR